MGVRKTFGANGKDLISLLLKNFLPATLTAFILSIPLIYTFATYFDSQFAYNSGIPLNLFLVSLFYVVVIIAVAVSYHYYQIVKLAIIRILKQD